MATSGFETSLQMLYEPGERGALDISKLGPTQWALANAIKRSADGVRGLPAATAAKPGQFSMFARYTIVAMTAFDPRSGGAEVAYRVSVPEEPALSSSDDPSARDVVGRFLDDLEREVAGDRCNSAVRRYLAATSWSKATALHDGRMVPMSAQFATEKPRRNHARVFEGEVIGVGFEPGAEYVRLREGSDVRQYAANAALVACAIELRDERVRASVFARGNKTILSSLGPAGGPFGGDAGARTERMVVRWREVLRELAK